MKCSHKFLLFNNLIDNTAFTKGLSTIIGEFHGFNQRQIVPLSSPDQSKLSRKLSLILCVSVIKVRKVIGSL